MNTPGGGTLALIVRAINLSHAARTELLPHAIMRNRLTDPMDLPELMRVS